MNKRLLTLLRRPTSTQMNWNLIEIGHNGDQIQFFEFKAYKILKKEALFTKKFLESEE